MSRARREICRLAFYMHLEMIFDGFVRLGFLWKSLEVTSASCAFRSHLAFTARPAIDATILVALVAFGYLTGSPMRAWAGVWATLHERTLTLAATALPGPIGAHSSLPFVPYLGFGLLAFAEAAAIGGLLGWIYASSRRNNAF